MNKNRIKNIFVLISIFLLILTLVSCGKKNNNNNNNNNNQEEQPKVEEKVTVYFNNDGNITNRTTTKGSLIKKITDPTSTKYQFEGWFFGDKKWDFDKDVVNEDITLNAHWTLLSYTLTVLLDNGEDDIIQTLEVDSPITSVTIPSKVGYTFDGWSKEFPATMPDHDVTIQAKWEINTYKVTFKYDNGTEDFVQELEYNSPIQGYTTPSKEGYAFDGWSIAVPANMPGYDLEISAVWKTIQYTLTINYNDDVSEPFILTYDYDAVVLPFVNPIRKHYIFDGWDKAIPARMPSEDIVITANWKDVIYTVTIENYSSTGESKVIEGIYNSTITLENPTRTNYSFVNYYTKANGEGEVVELSKMPDTYLTVYAYYLPDFINVNYVLNDGTNPENVKTVFYRDEENTLPVPTKEGYGFAGWYYDNNFATKVENIQFVKDLNITLYAKWLLVIDYPTSSLLELNYNRNEQEPTFSYDLDKITIVNTPQKGIGSYEAIFSLKDGYCWEDSSVIDYKMVWSIVKGTITFKWNNLELDYNGEIQKPEVSVDSSNINIDVINTSIGYRDAGTYQITVTSINEESIDSEEFTNCFIINSYSTDFTIKPISIDQVTINALEFTYNQEVHEITIQEVKAGTLTCATYSTEGTLSARNAGTYQFSILANGNFTGKIDKEFTVNKAEGTLSVASNTIERYCSQIVDMSTNIQYAIGTISYTIVESSTTTTSSISDNNITIGLCSADDDNKKAIKVSVCDSGNDNYLEKNVTFTINVNKRESSINATNMPSSMTYGSTYSINEIQVGSNLLFGDTREVFFAIDNSEYFTLSADCKTLTMTKASNNKQIAYKLVKNSSAKYKRSELECYIIIDKATGFSNASINSTFQFGTAATFNTGLDSSLSVSYQWWYKDENTATATKTNITDATTQEIRISQNILLIGKYLGCTATITETGASNNYNYTTVDVISDSAITDCEITNITYDVEELVVFSNYSFTVYFEGETVSSVVSVSNTNGITIYNQFTNNGFEFSMTTTGSDIINIYYISSNDNYYHGVVNVKAVPSSENENLTVTDGKFTYVELKAVGSYYIPNYYNGTLITTIASNSFNLYADETNIYITKEMHLENQAFKNSINSANIYYNGTEEEFLAINSNYASWGYTGTLEDDEKGYSHIFMLDDTGSYILKYEFVYKSEACVVEGTQVTLADGSKKNVEDIQYDDLLLVRDIINGGITYEYPLWIENASEVNQYTLISFDDESSIKVYGSHSFFDCDLMMFVDNGSLLQVGHSILKTKVVNGEIITYQAKITSIEEIEESVRLYHIFSCSMYNVITDDCVTTFYGEMLLNNYGYEEDYKMNEINRLNTINNNDNLYVYEDLSVILPYYMFVGFRAPETKQLELNHYFTYQGWINYIRMVVANPDEYQVMETNEDGKIIFTVSTSNDFVNNYVLEGDFYTLEEAKVVEGKTFVGYRDSVTNEIVQAGQSVKIDCSRCFIAIYE